MKVKFLKNHLNWKEGASANVDDSLGRYLLRVGVAKESKPGSKRKTKELKSEKKTK